MGKNNKNYKQTGLFPGPFEILYRSVFVAQQSLCKQKQQLIADFVSDSSLLSPIAIEFFTVVIINQFSNSNGFFVL